MWKTATDLDKILYRKNKASNNYTKMFKKNPDSIIHLQMMGEMDIEFIHKQIGHKLKISDKGEDAFL